MSNHFTLDEIKGLEYCFEHAVSAFYTDAHSADSGELANDVMDDLGLTDRECELLWILAENRAFVDQERAEKGLFSVPLGKGLDEELERVD